MAESDAERLKALLEAPVSSSSSEDGEDFEFSLSLNVCTHY